ncbi:MAG: hypothetical protein WC146_02165 [Patescibacteria group bacterium]|jgi:hypothetical protein
MAKKQVGNGLRKDGRYLEKIRKQNWQNAPCEIEKRYQDFMEPPKVKNSDTRFLELLSEHDDFED